VQAGVIADRSPVVLHSSDTLERAVELLAASRVDAVAVVAGDGAMLGVVSAWAVVRLALPAYAEALGDLGLVPSDFEPLEHRLADAVSIPVGRVAESDYAAVSEDTSLIETAWVMRRASSRIAFVLRDGVLVGTVELGAVLAELLDPKHHGR
jgi:CBS domain-containing protein